MKSLLKLNPREIRPQVQHNGFLLINKPPHLTSHDVVAQVRTFFPRHKVGHAGTLDPIATGLLILGIGRYTKKLSHFLAQDKVYSVDLLLGTTTDSQDISGKILKQCESVSVTLNELQAVCKTFLGKISQIPPMFSAKKIGGKRLYKLARKGLSVEREPVTITIHHLKIHDFDGKICRLEIFCSKGTYVRTLCHDIGKVLKVGGCLSQLTRTAIGKVSLKEAQNLENLSKMDRSELSKVLCSEQQLLEKELS